MPGLACCHVPETDGQVKIICPCGGGTYRSRLRRDCRERTTFLPRFDVPEPEGRGPCFERQERLAIRQERRHGRGASDNCKPFATAKDRVDDPFRRDVVAPNPAV